MPLDKFFEVVNVENAIIFVLVMAVLVGYIIYSQYCDNKQSNKTLDEINKRR